MKKFYMFFMTMSFMVYAQEDVEYKYEQKSTKLNIILELLTKAKTFKIYRPGTKSLQNGLKQKMEFMILCRCNFAAVLSF